MVDLSKIQGDKLIGLLHHLIRQKTILSVRLLGTEFERLTYIIDMDEGGANKGIIVDLPEGFRRAALDVAGWQLSFNFNGPDKLEYVFKVTGGEFCPQGLRLPFPEYIDRMQRRKNFRVMTPIGTRMVITVDDRKGLINLINISLGGAYGVLAKHNFSGREESFLVEGKSIDRAGIIFPEDHERPEHVVVIKEIQVRRIDHNWEKNIKKYAFEFMDFDPMQKRKLIQCIYHIQRQFLMRR